MVQSLTLTVLVDDQPGPQAVKAEHGLSFWIEADCFRILFDTGPGIAFAENAQMLGLSLAEVDAVVISHGHADHAGGVGAALTGCAKATFFMHPGALRTRYSRSPDGRMTSIGFPLPAGEQLRTRLDSVRWTTTATRLNQAVFVTGEVRRSRPSPQTAGRFFLDPDGDAPDPFSDDQALVVETSRGAVVCLGCSHAGVANTLQFALGLSRAERLRAVVGGMHLAGASAGELSKIGDLLESLGPDLICPCHCTGTEAGEYLKTRFPNAYRQAHAGTVLELRNK